jgi:hypothetical protein
VIIPRTSSEEEIPDVLIGGKGRRSNHPCYHAKYPEAVTLLSDQALRQLQSQYPDSVIFIAPYRVETNQAQGHAYVLDCITLINGYYITEVHVTPGSGGHWNGSVVGIKLYQNDRGNWFCDSKNSSFSNISAPYSAGLALALARASLNQVSPYTYSWGGSNRYDTGVPRQPDLSNLFGEDQRILSRYAWKHQLEYEWLLQHAFQDACHGIPRLNENSLQNIVEVVTGIAGICKTMIKGSSKHFVKELTSEVESDDALGAFDKLTTYQIDVTQEDAADAWLKYRYGYCTGKSDFAQYQTYVREKAKQWWEFLDKEEHKTIYGTSKLTVDGITVKCNCQLKYRPRTYQGLKSAVHYLWELGLEVNPYVLWDAIPFSFVVDWAAPIGDVAEAISDAKHYSSDMYEFSSCGFSMKYTMGEWGTRYYRWYQDPPEIDPSLWFKDDGGKPSGTLVAKRVGDTVALATQIFTR